MTTGFTLDINLLLEQSEFPAIAVHFARFIYSIADKKSPELFGVTLLLSTSNTTGNICLDLEQIPETPFAALPSLASISLTPVERLTAILDNCSVCGKPGDNTPLILDGNLLYLHKYWHFENSIAGIFKARASETIPIANSTLLLSLLDNYFPEDTAETNMQRMAAFVAATRKLCIITGGPGTGKTTTVLRIIALLIELIQNSKLRIALTAPTGKAAARIDEALHALRQKIDKGSLVDRVLPQSATTIHRLLGALPHNAQYKHGPKNPLNADIVVVDEASMIDVSLMYKLLSALPETARIIVMGDRDQLASVEAGAVFGDLCDTSVLNSFTRAFLASTAPFLQIYPDIINDDSSHELMNSIVPLFKTYRFSGPLMEASNALRQGRTETVLAIAESSESGSLSWYEHPAGKPLFATIAPVVLHGWEQFCAAGTIPEMFRTFSQFRVLCVVRSGPYGVETINRTIETILADAGRIIPAHGWYPKQPVMITKNDYTLKLYNGDTGIIAPDPAAGGELRAWFPLREPGGTTHYRPFSPSRLPAHEKAFAITVHKSQGAEFDSVLLLLPDQDVPLLTRELIYTGMTRSRTQTHVCGRLDIFKTGVQRTINRKSGLRRKLWGTVT